MANTSPEPTDPTTKMNLAHDITVNGRTYRAGSNVEVPRKSADDIARMDYDYSQYETNLHRKRTMEVNSGTIAMGGSE